MIYYWSCQTNVKNISERLKVNGLHLKALFTSLRAFCTVALHQHMPPLGGPGKTIEVGVISIDKIDQQTNNNVYVLGALDSVSKIVRLHSIVKRSDDQTWIPEFLAPLSLWVDKESIIATDLSVSKNILESFNYQFIDQTTGPDGSHGNSNVMNYLHALPHLFGDTFSQLSPQHIQQILNELVWREHFGTSPAKAFDHIISHIAEQTQLNGPQSLAKRLAMVR